MRRLIAFFICLCASAVPAFSADDFKLPAVERFVTSNGISVVCIHDDLPKITVSASVCAGYLYETQANAGLTDITARLLSISGTAAHPQSELDKTVDATGSRFSVHPDWETVTVSFQALDEFSDLACETVSGILSTPALRAQEFELCRSLVKEHIIREDQDPFSAVYGRARAMLFDGKGYGVRATAATAASVTLENMSSFWASSVRSGNLVLAVASPRPASEIRALVEKYFSRIPRGSRIDYTASVPSSTHLKSLDGTVYFLERAIPQSTVVFCAPAPDVRSDSAYPLRVADEILGGGEFNAKLTKEIREKRGLAYSTGSIIRMRRNAGVFIAYAQCDADKTGESFSLMKECISQMRSGDFSADDLDLARQSISRSYVFGFDTPLNVLSHYLSLWYNNLPDSYLSSYTSKILSQQPSDVKKSFSSMTDGGMVTVVIGNKQALDAVKGKGKVVILSDQK